MVAPRYVARWIRTSEEVGRGTTGTRAEVDGTAPGGSGFGAHATKIRGPRICRSPHNRADPCHLHSHVLYPGLQNSFGLHGADPADRRPHLGEQDDLRGSHARLDFGPANSRAAV